MQAAERRRQELGHASYDDLVKRAVPLSSIREGKSPAKIGQGGEDFIAEQQAQRQEVRVLRTRDIKTSDVNIDFKRAPPPTKIEFQPIRSIEEMSRGAHPGHVVEVSHTLIASDHDSGRLVARLGKLDDGTPVILRTYSGKQAVNGEAPPWLLSEGNSVMLIHQMHVGPKYYAPFKDAQGRWNIVTDIVPGDISTAPNTPDLPITHRTFKDLENIFHQLRGAGLTDLSDEFEMMRTPEGRLVVIHAGDTVERLGKGPHGPDWYVGGLSEQRFQLLLAADAGDGMAYLEHLLRFETTHPTPDSGRPQTGNPKAWEILYDRLKAAALNPKSPYHNRAKKYARYVLPEPSDVEAYRNVVLAKSRESILADLDSPETDPSERHQIVDFIVKTASSARDPRNLHALGLVADLRRRKIPAALDLTKMENVKVTSDNDMPVPTDYRERVGLGERSGVKVRQIRISVEGDHGEPGEHQAWFISFPEPRNGTPHALDSGPNRLDASIRSALVLDHLGLSASKFRGVYKRNGVWGYVIDPPTARKPVKYPRDILTKLESVIETLESNGFQTLPGLEPLIQNGNVRFAPWGIIGDHLGRPSEAPPNGVEGAFTRLRVAVWKQLSELEQGAYETSLRVMAENGNARDREIWESFQAYTSKR
jgi:hypothetical protein